MANEGLIEELLAVPRVLKWSANKDAWEKADKIGGGTHLQPAQVDSRTKWFEEVSPIGQKFDLNIHEGFDLRKPLLRRPAVFWMMEKGYTLAINW